jgi:Flp pilus assembly protein TadG
MTALLKIVYDILAIKRDRRGIAALEFAIMAPVLIIIVLNLCDVAAYVYKAMEVANSAAMGAVAAWQACPPGKQPATYSSNCPGLIAAVQTAIHATSLGAAVSLVTNPPSEGYYCVDIPTNALQLRGNVSSSPPNCGNGISAGDYIIVQVSYTYTPTFFSSPYSVANLLTSPIVSSSMFRLN